MLDLQFPGLAKKRFRGDGEKFGGIGGAIGAEQGRFTGFNFLPEPFVFGLQHARPIGVMVFAGAQGFAIGAGDRPQQGCAVGVAILKIELVGEFMDDDIGAAMGGKIFADFGPGEHDGAVRPGFTGARLMDFSQDAMAEMTCDGGDIAGGIYEDGSEVG